MNQKKRIMNIKAIQSNNCEKHHTSIPKLINKERKEKVKSCNQKEEAKEFICKNQDNYKLLFFFFFCQRKP
jgi:hypothetical protein